MGAPRVIDAHQHVWDLDRARYDWLGESLAPVNRTIQHEELRPVLRSLGITATILVQSADNAEDSAYMFEVADRSPEVVGVVAYAPLHEGGRTVARVVAGLRQHAKLVGVRNLIHDRPDPDWLLRPDVNDGLSALADADLPFDVVATLPRHLEHVSTIAARHPRLRLVIDHLAKPPIGAEGDDGWSRRIAAAAEHPNVSAKVSGLYGTRGDPADWTVDAIRPFFEHALAVFGPERLMYGGDWPISILAGGYERVRSGLAELFGALDDRDREQIEWRSAAEFYRIDPARLDRITT